MDVNEISVGSVVVGVDGSRESDRALDWAAAYAKREGRDLVLVHSLDDTAAMLAWVYESRIDPTSYVQQIEEGGQAVLDTAMARVAPDRPPGRVESLLTRVDPRSVLLEAAERADVLVLGSRGHGPVRDLLLGSVSVAVARHAACPVVVVRPHRHGSKGKGVLVGADGSPSSLAVLEFAYRQASELDAPLTVLHTVWEGPAGVGPARELQPESPRYPEGELALAESLAGLGEKFPDVAVDRSVIWGTPAGGLINLADGMELVVVGRHPARAFVGSIAVHVLEHAATAVAVVPQG
ncbi:universal stress protein [Marmoricola sp. RAF53]|uniref:universal stress protein n=1 Tax=Marmoricola sp. RAF53 TaxID=3233059 RepID=UPI003F9DBD8F